MARVRWVVLALCALLLVLATAPADVHAAAPARTISLQLPATATAGAGVAVRGTVARTPRGSRVVLQRKSGARWVTVARTRTSTKAGAFRTRLRVPSSAGSHRYRAVAPRHGAARRVVSAPRTIVIRKAPGPIVPGPVTPGPVGPGPVAPSPAGVTDLRATSTPSRVVLTWTNPAGTTGIVVRRAAGTVPPATSTSGTAVPTDPVSPATRVTDNDVRPGDPYAYAVFATTAAGTSRPTSVRRPGPAPVEEIWTTKAPGSITFHWTNPPGVARVIVDVDTIGGVPLGPEQSPPPGTDVGPATSHTVSGLAARQAVGITVYVLDASGNYTGSSTSSDVALDGTGVAPPPISAPTAETAPRSVTLRWTAPASGGSSHVAIARLEGTTAPAAPTSGWVLHSPDGAQAVDDLVEPGRTYTYGFWVVDTGARHSSRETLTVTTPQGSPPAPVTGLSATALSPAPARLTTGDDPARVRLRWTTPADAEAVVVARAEGRTAPASPLEGGGWNLATPVDTLLDRTLEPDTEYTYALWAVGQDGSYASVATTTVRSDPHRPRPVRGRIIDSRTAAVLGGVPLTFRPTGTIHPAGSATRTATSRADGGYEVALPVGSYSACVDGPAVTGGSAQGYVHSCTTLTVTAGATTTRDLPIHRAVTVRGVMTDDTTGAPVAGARVTVSHPAPHLGSKTAVTDAVGRYVITGVSVLTDPELYVSSDPTTATSGPAQGYEPVMRTELATAVHGDTVELNLSATPRRLLTFSGRVTGSLGAPVSGVGVHLVDARGVRDDTDPVFTGPDGRYTVTVAPIADETRGVCFDAERHQTPGAATGLANQCAGGAGFDPEPNPIESDPSTYGTTTQFGQSSTVDIALASTTTVSGRVTAADGTPLAGAVVAVSMHFRVLRRTATTDATGRYSVAVGTPVGATQVPILVCADASRATGGPSAGGYGIAQCQSQAVDGDTHVTGLDFVAPPATTLVGTVRDLATNAPLSGIRVEVSQHSGSVSTVKTTASDGVFTHRLIPESGRTYHVCAVGPGRSTTCRTLAELGVPTLSTGATFQLRALLLSEDGSIEGVLTGADTATPLAGVTVTVQGGPDGSGGDSTVTGADGRYTFPDRPPGRYRLSAKGNNLGPRGYHQSMRTDVDVTSGARTTADLAMRPAAAVRVKVVTQDGRPAPGVRVGVRSYPSYSATTDAQGRATVTGLVAADRPDPGGVCAGLGSTVGPGTRAGYTTGCGTMPTLTDGATATTTVVVGLQNVFGAHVLDAATGEPIAGADVTLIVANGNGYLGHRGPTDAQGFAYPYTSIMPPGGGGPSANPARPRFSSARICVTALGYRPACWRDGPPTDEAGPVMRGRPGLLTIATLALTPL